MSVPSDEHFVKVLEQTWGISEEEEAAISRDKVRELINLMRQRLLVFSNSSHEEFVLRKIFKDFDLNKSGAITSDEMQAMLAKLGILVEKKYVNAMMKVLDTSKSG